MGFHSIDKIAVRGITVCVPKNKEENISLPDFSDYERNRIVESTGIRERRVVDDGVTPSDLCVKAAEELLTQVQWSNEDVDCLVFVATNRDYLQPNTSCVIHHRLGLNEGCLAIDVPCGCPGWIYGLFVAGSLMQTGQMKKCLLLVGDTSTRMNYPFDKSARPIFGDAGTATALEFDETAKRMQFSFATVSKGWEQIITTDGGARNPFTEASLRVETTQEGFSSRPIDCRMNGMNVFAFSLSVPPRVVKDLIAHFDIDINKVDYFLCHQTNKYIVDKIRKKVGFSTEKTPISLDEYGNTSNASIPLAIIHRCEKDYNEREVNSIAVAFGTGLMCGAVQLYMNQIKTNLIDY